MKQFGAQPRGPPRTHDDKGVSERRVRMRQLQDLQHARQEEPAARPFQCLRQRWSVGQRGVCTAGASLQKQAQLDE
jgi:hypothetical protein